MNSIRITLISLFVASSSYAEEIVKFVSLDACKAYYAKSVTPVANETADTYCKNRIMSFVEACTATKIAEFVKAQKLNSFSDLSDTEQRTKKANFSYQCQATQQNEVAGNAAKAAQARAASASASGGSAAGATMTAAQKNAQNLAVLQAVTPLVTGLANDIEKAQKAAIAQQTGAAATPAADKAVTTAAQSVTQPTAQSTGTASQPAAAPTQQAVAQPTTQTAQPNSAATPTAEVAKIDPKATAAETANAKSSVPSAGDDVVKEMPETKKAVDEMKEATAKVDENSAPPEPTAITTLAEKTSAVMKKEVDTIDMNAQNQVFGMYGINYSESSRAFRDLQKATELYTTSAKKTCAESAESASYVCVEGTSPHAIFAKKVMDASGPILAVANSAIKACSSTAKVTRFVGLGLTVAKGVCVAAKLRCDFNCSSAVKDLGQMQASLQSKIAVAIDTDWGKNNSTTCSKACSADTTGSCRLSCQEENERIKQVMITQMKALVNPLKSENTPATKGTSPSIVQSCEAHGKDILMFAMQAGGAYLAHKNAKECETKLAASSGGGSTITTQQYCEKSENVSSQICVCQKNPMANGCPGAIAADSSNATDGSSEKGSNIKGVGGASAFAGGFGVKPPSSKEKLGKDGVNAALAATGSTTSNGESAAGGDSGGGLGGGGSGGLGAGAGGSSETAAAKKAAEEKKKWSFGAFQSESAAGSLGGFGGSGSAAGKYKSGALTASDQAALQRQIASEKFAAEVSTASGKSNWEKVRNMYLIKENSFIFGQ